MPRPGPRMSTVSIRMPDEEIAVVDGIAEREQLNRSEAARMLVSYAAPRMPEGWRPDDPADLQNRATEEKPRAPTTTRRPPSTTPTRGGPAHR